jgi:hypothetical protein
VAADFARGVGAKIFADALAEYCPACLLEAGLDLLKDHPAFAGETLASLAIMSYWKKSVVAAKASSIARARKV